MISSKNEFFFFCFSFQLFQLFVFSAFFQRRITFSFLEAGQDVLLCDFLNILHVWGWPTIKKEKRMIFQISILLWSIHIFFVKYNYTNNSKKFFLFKSIINDFFNITYMKASMGFFSDYGWRTFGTFMRSGWSRCDTWGWWTTEVTLRGCRDWGHDTSGRMSTRTGRCGCWWSWTS